MNAWTIPRNDLRPCIQKKMISNNKLGRNMEDKDKNYPEIRTRAKVKFEVYGEEMIEKQVKSSGNSGRIYLPPNWVGHTVKIIKVE